MLRVAHARRESSDDRHEIAAWAPRSVERQVIGRTDSKVWRRVGATGKFDVVLAGCERSKEYPVPRRERRVDGAGNAVYA